MVTKIGASGLAACIYNAPPTDEYYQKQLLTKQFQLQLCQRKEY